MRALTQTVELLTAQLLSVQRELDATGNLCDEWAERCAALEGALSAAKTEAAGELSAAREQLDALRAAQFEAADKEDVASLERER